MRVVLSALIRLFFFFFQSCLQCVNLLGWNSCEEVPCLNWNENGKFKLLNVAHCTLHEKQRAIQSSLSKVPPLLRERWHKGDVVCHTWLWCDDVIIFTGKGGEARENHGRGTVKSTKPSAHCWEVRPHWLTDCNYLARTHTHTPTHSQTRSHTYSSCATLWLRGLRGGREARLQEWHEKVLTAQVCWV